MRLKRFSGATWTTHSFTRFTALPQKRTTGATPRQVHRLRHENLQGVPDRAHFSTSFVERSNLSMRMSMRRFTRLTNAFSKKLDNQEHALAVYFMHYNFCRVHQTLPVTPAMKSGIANHVWSIEKLVSLMEPKSMLDGLPVA